jgi:hypothetical protein
MSFLCDDCAGVQGINRPVSRNALNGLYEASKVNASGGLLGLENSTSLDGTDEALGLADEVLSAFLQTGLGRAQGGKRR